MNVNLVIALLCLVLICLLFFLWTEVVLPKLSVMKLANINVTHIKLTDELAEKVFVVAIIFFLAVFMLLYHIIGDLVLMLLSQLMTLKLLTGFEHYKQWLEESKAHTHQWKLYILYLLFYIFKKK